MKAKGFIMRPIRQWTVHNVWEQNARWTTTTVCSFRACLWRVVNCPVSTYCISNLECIWSYLLVHTVVLLPTYNLQYDSMIHFQQCSRWFKVHTYNIRYWHRDMWLIKIWPFMSFGMLICWWWMGGCTKKGNTPATEHSLLSGPVFACF